MRTLLTTLLAFLTLVGCETRTHKQLRLKHQALLIEHERVLEQMNKIWLQSLKARFPLITELEPGKQISLDPKRMRYIHSLQFEPDPHLANQWQNWSQNPNGQWQNQWQNLAGQCQNQRPNL